MTRVLLVGYDPETVDYSNPALPPGMSAEKIRPLCFSFGRQFTQSRSARECEFEPPSCVPFSPRGVFTLTIPFSITYDP